MKNILKKCSVLFLAMIMTMLSVMPAMAAEPETTQETEAIEIDSGYEVYEEEFILEPGDSINEDDINSAVSTLSTIDQTFTMGSYHRGADRTYSTSHLKFMITITDTSGNATSSTVSLGFQDYNGNSMGWLISADGSTFSKNAISIVAGRTYYFTYTNNGSQNLKVHMVITSY